MSAEANNLENSHILLKQIKSGVVTLTLNRPSQYNALSGELLFALQKALDEISGDESVKVVIITARGKAFCAGHDLKELRSNTDRSFHRTLFERCSRMMLSINQLPQPVLASVNGIATAAGCQLVAACDLAVAAETAQFAVSGINVGLFCSTPAVPLSRSMLPKHAMKMLLTGDFIDASTARQFGLINDVVPDIHLENVMQKLAEKIAAKSAFAVRTGKKMFYKQSVMDIEDAYHFASETIVNNMASDDAREGIAAFIEKRKPEWRDQ